MAIDNTPPQQGRMWRKRIEDFRTQVDNMADEKEMVYIRLDWIHTILDEIHDTCNAHDDMQAELIFMKLGENNALRSS